MARIDEQGRPESAVPLKSYQEDEAMARVGPCVTRPTVVRPGDRPRFVFVNGSILTLTSMVTKEPDDPGGEGGSSGNGGNGGGGSGDGSGDGGPGGGGDGGDGEAGDGAVPGDSNGNGGDNEGGDNSSAQPGEGEGDVTVSDAGLDDLTTFLRDYSFDSCEEARATLVGQQVASTQPELRYWSGNDVQVTHQADGTFQAMVQLYWGLDRANTIVELPSWGNPPSAADRRAWNAMQGALATHEAGHIDLAEQYAAELSGETLYGEGASERDARADLMRNLKQHEQDVAQELDRREGVYDDLTEHGASQSVLGGVDVTLECPNTLGDFVDTTGSVG